MTHSKYHGIFFFIIYLPFQIFKYDEYTQNKKRYYKRTMIFRCIRMLPSSAKY